MENQKKIAIIGSGGHASVVASTLTSVGHQVVGFYDDDEQRWGDRIFDIPIVGAIDKLNHAGNFSHAVVAIGDNKIRKKIVEKLYLDWITVVHPFAWVHPEVIIGVGTVVCAGAIIQPGAKIGSHVIVNTKASVDHHCRVGDYVHMAVSHLAGGASLDEGVFMALGSIVLPGVHVGSWATVGAGALVTKNVAPEITVVGSPARSIKRSSK